jgi:hypothetical protein
LATVFAIVLALVVAAAAFAAPPTARDLARQFFDTTFIRAEIVSVVGRTRDYRIDEGKVAAVRAGAIDLLERDGSRQTIRIGPTTQIVGVGRLTGPQATLRVGRVVTVREGDGPAVLVRPSSTMRALAKTFLGATLARAEILSYSTGVVHDFRLDQGKIVGVRSNVLVIAERDGSRQSVKLGAATAVTFLGQPVDVATLTRGLPVLTIREGDEAAEEVRILPGGRR